jgi:acyl dehydratase
VSYPHHDAEFMAVISKDLLTFEDFKPGHFGSFGPRHVTREEIIAFAAEYDPQPMHLDEEAAKHTMLRGLAGSGWHLCAIMMRMLYDGFIHRTASLGGPGIDELNWLAPLRPGDDITLDIYVLESRVSRNRPQMGLITMKVEIHNAARHKLLEAKWPVMIGRRDASAAN